MLVSTAASANPFALRTAQNNMRQIVEGIGQVSRIPSGNRVAIEQRTNDIHRQLTSMVDRINHASNFNELQRSMQTRIEQAFAQINQLRSRANPPLAALNVQNIQAVDTVPAENGDDGDGTEDSEVRHPSGNG